MSKVQQNVAGVTKEEASQLGTQRVSEKNINTVCYPNNWESMGQGTPLKMAKSSKTAIKQTLHGDDYSNVDIF